MDEDWDEDDYDADVWDDAHDDERLTCPECRADVHPGAEACPVCGYWITDADRSAAWRASSASGRIITIGLWALGAAALAMLFAWLR